jgi:hypothetical protein
MEKMNRSEFAKFIRFQESESFIFKPEEDMNLAMIGADKIISLGYSLAFEKKKDTYFATFRKTKSGKDSLMDGRIIMGESTMLYSEALCQAIYKAVIELKEMGELN